MAAMSAGFKDVKQEVQLQGLLAAQGLQALNSKVDMLLAKNKREEEQATNGPLPRYLLDFWSKHVGRLINTAPVAKIVRALVKWFQDNKWVGSKSW